MRAWLRLDELLHRVGLRLLQSSRAEHRSTGYVVKAPHYVGSHEELKRALIEMGRRGQLDVIRRSEKVATPSQWAQIRGWLGSDDKTPRSEEP